MGKKKARSSVPAEEHLLLPLHHTANAKSTVVDTHTHIASTFAAYQGKYPDGAYATVFDFVRGVCVGRKVEAIVDVWCEAPVQKLWKDFANSALTSEDRDSKWGGINYWFVMGVHPHEAKLYSDAVERDILEAMAHPRCVGWGEIGLDYHYDNSPRDVQREVLIRQLRQAVKLGKPLTIHTREADEDTERILKQEVPENHKIHIHCFTDSPDFARRLLDYFPNLYIGITGVITYSSNLNTSDAIRHMITREEPLRILLETDAPYMVPGNIYASLSALKGGRLPLCHTAMIPWTADFVAGVAGEGWDSEKVMNVARENARKMYSV